MCAQTTRVNWTNKKHKILPSASLVWGCMTDIYISSSRKNKNWPTLCFVCGFLFSPRISTSAMIRRGSEGHSILSLTNIHNLNGHRGIGYYLFGKLIAMGASLIRIRLIFPPEAMSNGRMWTRKLQLSVKQWVIFVKKSMNRIHFTLLYTFYYEISHRIPRQPTK